MRKWFKYSLRYEGAESPDLTRDNSVSVRSPDYLAFIQPRVKSGDEILSVGAGSGYTEDRITGVTVTCTDLVSNGKASALNIVMQSAGCKYDGAICLSTIYLFDELQLASTLRNICASLRSGGYLILDSAGSPDNWLSWFIHDVWLPSEFRLFQCLRWLQGRPCMVECASFGWRRTDKEILTATQHAGFALVEQKNYAFLNEFRRSVILGIAMRFLPARAILSALGRLMPYTRMFQFRKVE